MTEAQQEFDELIRRNTERHARHPEDRGVKDEGEEEQQQQQQLDDVVKQSPQPRQSLTASRDMIPKQRYGANTGPKGVISDAQNFQESKRTHRLSTRLSTTIPPEPAFSFGQQLEMDRLARNEELGNLEENDDLDDDDFMKQWRQQRLHAMQNGDYNSSIHEKSRKSVFTGIQAVDGEGYLEAIEGSGADVVVVVYIYDDASDVSDLFEDCLRSLAGKYKTTRFIKLHYQEAEIQIAGVPGLIAYRGGEKFAALIPLLDEMPDDGDLNAQTLEIVLQKHQILR